MKKNIFLFVFCLCVISLNAQNDCETSLRKAKNILEKKSPFIDQSILVPLLEPCAMEGNAQAENYLGLMYLNAIGVEKDLEKTYRYISSAANKDYVKAQYNMGRLYKYGMGCELNFNKAIDWFERAAANGNQRAAYSLGYMYYKGYGVSQDYQKAVYWFKHSDDDMAKHFLAICYYFGYGIAANENKSLELLLSNPTTNSKSFLTYIQAKLKENNKKEIEEILEAKSSTDSTYVAPKLITDQDIEEYQETLTPEDIEGEWVGKIIRYDWSGKHIEHILPLSINFKRKNNKVLIKTIIGNQQREAIAKFTEGNLFIESDLIVSLQRLYTNNLKKLSLDYTFFTLSMQKKELLGDTYLTGALDTYIESWTEYGQPMSIVLKRKGTETNVIDNEILEALAGQDDQFIKLYPVPFNNQLTVQYQLERPGEVSIELQSLYGANRIIILPNTLQKAGNHTFTVPVDAGLSEGLYVVRLKAGSQIYTRMIIKENN